MLNMTSIGNADGGHVGSAAHRQIVHQPDPMDQNCACFTLAATTSSGSVASSVP